MSKKKTQEKPFSFYEASGKYYIKYVNTPEQEISKTWYMSLLDEKEKQHQRLNKKH